MSMSLRSLELESLLTRIHTKKATGFVSITVRGGGRSIYGTLQILKGQLLAAQFEANTGRVAVEKIASLEMPEVSFAASQVNAKRDADIPALVEMLNLEDITTTVPEVQASSAGLFNTSGLFNNLSVRAKMLLLFSVLPMLILLGLGTFYLFQVRNMSSVLTDNATAIVTTLAQDAISLHAQEVAAEAGRHIAANPGLTAADFQTDPTLKEIATRTVGQTGFAALMEGAFAPGDQNNVWWVHPNDALIGKTLDSMGPKLGPNFPVVKDLLESLPGTPGGRVSGFYDGIELDGSLRERFMATARIPGTPYFIASSSYIDEFTQPMTALQTQSSRIVGRTSIFVIFATLAAILFTLLSVALYGERLSKRIQALSSIAESISMGRLDDEIAGTDQNDEIGVLARSIERLRTSVQVMFSELDNRH